MASHVELSHAISARLKLVLEHMLRKLLPIYTVLSNKNVSPLRIEAQQLNWFLKVCGSKSDCSEEDTRYGNFILKRLELARTNNEACLARFFVAITTTPCCTKEQDSNVVLLYATQAVSNCRLMGHGKINITTIS